MHHSDNHSNLLTRDDLNRFSFKKVTRCFSFFFDHSEEMILLLDPALNRILVANARACRLLQYEREELLSTSLSSIHFEPDLFRGLARVEFRKTGIWGHRLNWVTKVGRSLPVRVLACPIRISEKRLVLVLARVEHGGSCVNNRKRKRASGHRLGSGKIIAKSPAFNEILHRIEQGAPTDLPVLITGETGTGKELIAKRVHEKSRRAEHSFVHVNCASIPGELFESEFFGHVKGAYTGAIRNRIGRFEMADGGTIFLDEIGEIPLAFQSKLLRVLQEGCFDRVGESAARYTDVRLIAATNKNLWRESRKGRFRADLYYRINVFPIEVPPLRNHKEDIAPLARHFLEKTCRQLQKESPKLTADHLRLLEGYPWYGNVRELENIIQRAAVMAKDGHLDFELNHEEVYPCGIHSIRRQNPTLHDLRKLEKEIILESLERAKGKVSGPGGAAQILGMKPSTLSSKIKKWGLRFK